MQMQKLFDDARKYQPGDPEVVEVMGPKDKQAQMRHRGTAPTYYRLGRKIIYMGVDMNTWAEAQRIESAIA